MALNRIIKILIIFLIVAPIFAQDLESNIISLENSFKSFEYKKVIQRGKFLLADPYTSSADSIQIYQLMLSSAYALNDTTQAKEIILDILEYQPEFSLDPIQTSPKIVEFFNFVKQQQYSEKVPIQPDSSAILIPVDFKKPAAQIILSGVLFPGSAHLIQGDKSKGVYFSSISGALLAGSIYFYFKTNSDRDLYMEAKEGDSFNRLYKNYNHSYQTRNMLTVLYGIWSIYCLYDFYENLPISPVYSPDHQTIGLNFQFHLD